MKLVIDFRNICFRQNELRVFTYEFWEDMTRFQPGYEFVVITGQKMAAWPAPNTRVQYLKKTGLRWLDGFKFKKFIAGNLPDRLITVRQSGFTVGMYENGAWRTGQEVVFAGSEPALQPANAVTELTIAMRQQPPSLTWAAEESLKTQFTAGRSFFLFIGDISEHHRLIELLKAFSAFKKWQQSNMQLVIAGSSTDWTDIFEEKLSTYKYKHDVTLLKNAGNNDIANLTAACYAMVYPGVAGFFPLALTWAIQGQKAIIATDTAANRKIIDAAAWVDDKNMAEGFATAMIRLYKDENQQQLLVQQTSAQAAQCNRQQMLAAAWQCIGQ